MNKLLKDTIKAAGGGFAIRDNSNFEPGMCLNGGHYGYTEKYQVATWYEKTPDGLILENRGWIVTHTTTHEFGICPGCGDLCQSSTDYELHQDCDPRRSPQEVAKARLHAKVEAWKGEKGRFGDWPAVEIV